MTEPQKVSFTVRRPSPVSRSTSSAPDVSSFKPPLPRYLVPSTDSTPLGSPLARSETASPYYKGYDDSSDEDDEVQDELVTGFDRFGVQRCVHPEGYFLQYLNSQKSLHLVRLNEDKRKKKQEPLIIPAQKNKDWQELARKRRNVRYVPPSAAAQTGADGSVGGLGTRDTIGSGPVLKGLQNYSKAVKVEEQAVNEVLEDIDVKMEPEQLSEDELARRAVLAEANGVPTKNHIIDIIPTPITETDAYKQDVEELPDVATLDDYNRVPVDQFGAAMLRGMGWKEGTAASKNGKGMVEPYTPAARPALLGIGAKEREVFDDGSKKRGPLRPERKYVPLLKKEKDGGTGSSRDRSRSPGRGSGRSTPAGDIDRSDRRRDRDDGYDRKRARDRDDRERERDRERGKDRERDRDRERTRDRESSDKRDREKRRDYDRDYSSRRERSRDSTRKRSQY